MTSRAAAGLHRVSSSIERGLSILLGLLLGFLTALLFIQVVLRFGFNESITWAEEVPRIILIWLVFVGLVPTIKGQHLIIDVLKDRLWLRALSTFVKWAALVFFLIWGYDLVTRVVDQRMPVTQVSRAWQYAAVPVGAGLAALVGLDEIIEMIRTRHDPNATAGKVQAASILSAGADHEADDD